MKKVLCTAVFKDSDIDNILYTLNTDTPVAPNDFTKSTFIVHGKTVFDNIRAWAAQRGIYNSGDPKTQFTKLIEEVGELAKAILTKNNEEFADAVGDIIVVLTNLTVLYNIQNDYTLDLTVEECIESAYNEIKDRTGKMENNTFVKD